jgi:proteasome lid subunit RPN8/RPN11
VNLIQEISRAYAEVQRGSPGAREKLERLQAEYRTSGEITRVGGTCQLEGRPSAPFSYRARSRSVSRDVLNYGHPSSAVEIRARATESRPFTVSLTAYSREQILDEIRHIRRQGDLEAAGWMWASQTPRSWSDGLTVALATHAGASRHGRYSVEVGNPYVLREEQCPPELRHLKVIGDWHSHPIAGSTTPSDTDAKAWAGWMDRYGLARFSAVIVSPAEQGGWTYPVFSAWTVRREGHPSLPVCEPARIE